jgi:two-component system chemotaxis response regulator CheY
MHISSDHLSKKILIVDDSRVSRMIIRAHVKQSHPEWTIVEADSGDRAVEMADLEMPDYCTMDINMPGMLGTDAAEIIQRKYPAMRIAIFSGNIQQASRVRSTLLGSTFIAKPVTAKSIDKAFKFFLYGLTDV